MPIPKTREELADLLADTYARLAAELDSAGSGVALLPCVDDWTVKELLAVRAWWSEAVVGWIEAGRRGERPVTPAPGFGWSETPRLNREIARASRDEPWASVRGRLEAGYRRAVATVRALDDEELLAVGAFPWAGRWPLARWLSINTARQYTTARTFVRRALRAAGATEALR
jgi:hypothetical protein